MMTVLKKQLPILGWNITGILLSKIIYNQNLKAANVTHSFHLSFSL